MKKVLVIAGGGMGDMFMTTPMLRALHKTFPDTVVHVLIVQSVNKFLLDGYPGIEKIIDWNKFNGNTMGLISTIRKERYDLAIHNHSCPRWRFYTVPFLAGVKKRLGFDRTSTGKGLKTWFQRALLTQHVPYTTKSGLRTRMNLDILKTIGVENDDLNYQVHLAASSHKNAKRIGIHPGSDGKGAIKRWPIESFYELAETLVDKYQKEVVFYLGPAERNLKENIQTRSGIGIAELGSIAELYHDMSLCGAFISNDSGLSHMAAALKLPTVVIFGPTSPQEYILPVPHRNVCVEGYDCSKCFRTKECTIKPPTCMTTIGKEKVLSAVLELEKETKPQ